MSTPAIRVDKVGKKYRLRHQQSGRRYKALRDVITEAPKRLLSRFSGAGNVAQGAPSREDFWALRDVSFEIQQGQAVGIIGRNGAGKSTLLKLLSRITEPSTGRIEIDGRIASLLEVGTGFHPELTGRENIYLNGAILGMTRQEIKSRFDEIVAFAEVEKFLDTPVKHYSSGMYVRLAFAVAAHLEQEILIVDEVLAVGDLEFQKKCLGRMERAVGQEGRTVLFVSHNMDLIAKLCDHAILLNAGQVETSGTVDEVTHIYLSRAGTETKFAAAQADRPLRYVEVDETALREEKLVLRIGYQFAETVVNPTFGAVLYTETGNPIFGSNTLYHPPEARSGRHSKGEAVVTFPHIPIWSGRYQISVWLTDNWTPIDHQENVVMFDFVSTSAPINAPSPKFVGPVYIPATWTI